MSKTNFEVDREQLEVRITRIFKATPERLWQAYTDPTEIVQWWADTVVDKHDFTVGGAWRFVSGPDGKNAFRGEFKEIDRLRKIVRTFEYEPMAGHVMTESVTFEPQPGGSTKVVTISKFDNPQDLEGMVGSGMEHGASEGLDRLAKVVEQDQETPVSDNHKLTLTRTFDAPRDVVWKAWTDEARLAEWWGPQGFTTPVSELDVRPGGNINVVMEDSAGLIKKGSRYPMTGNFKQIVEPELIVYESSAIMNDKPIMENLVTVKFEDIGGKTKLTLDITVTKATPEAEMPLRGMETGWSQSLDKLSELLENGKTS